MNSPKPQKNKPKLVDSVAPSHRPANSLKRETNTSTNNNQLHLLRDSQIESGQVKVD